MGRVRELFNGKRKEGVGGVQGGDDERIRRGREIVI